ncbi:polysaccharide deacetylase family protein [Thalassotalea psychrophila]|uniref:Polysaccharide deacetylase family protein n=1 Tax=Thalassotalea psychrophila TaxID=3065647 RepID=A0ABY9TWA2_9GAMM|nr:polysaccharide deacetylase family protein [Colwelliaceae bacterium SQ149]
MKIPAIVYLLSAIITVYSSLVTAQEALRQIKVLDEQSKIIALTFDDGPILGVTQPMLSLLDKYQAKATFFNIGKKIKQNPQLTHLVIASGHEIGNHSWSHKKLTELNSEQQQLEIHQFQQQAKLVGLKPTLFRAPFLKTNQSIEQLLIDEQLLLVSASVMAKDAKKNVAVNNIVKKLSEGIKSGDIILMHEREHTLQALKILLPLWKQEGYQFVTVSQLIALSVVTED